MQYTSRTGDRDTQAHVNYQCPCGCKAGLLYDRHEGAEHLGACCCGRLLWVGEEAESVILEHRRDGVEYEIDLSSVTLPWGQEIAAALAVPLPALVSEQAKRDAGRTLTKVTDPVCHMMIDPADAAGSSTHKKQTYYFCATSCKTRFDANPTRYVQGKTLLQRLFRR